MWVSCECSSGFGIASLVLMVASSTQRSSRRKSICLFAVAMMISIPLSFTLEADIQEISLESDFDDKMGTQGDTEEIWTDGGQPWPQFGRTATRIGDLPIHGPDGGADFGDPSNSSSLMSIVEPLLNWVYGTYSIGNDALSTPIVDMGNSVEVGTGAEQRCGDSSLFTVVVQTEDVSGSDHSILKMIEGEYSELAWEVDLGETETVKSAPVVVDIDEDGNPEIVVVFDAGGSMNVEVWSPRLSCSVTGWSSSGHSDEMLWSWDDEDLMISSGEGPYTSGIFGGHKPTTQPLLADLNLDGDAELVIAAIDQTSEEPVVLAMPLQTNGTPNSLWQVSLSKGSHPSDPAFAQIDENTGYVVLTTIEAQNGNMWAWKIDSSTGSSIWQNGLDLNNLDGDTNVPHVRLPGPVVANLDSDSDPELILTIPTDVDGSNSVDGAEFRGIEISDGTQLWEFEATNGFADAPPTAIDTDGDGDHDRVCWVTWWQTTTDRHGATGCHDVESSVPNEEWTQDLEQSSGTPNDEIAVSSPTWMDIDSLDEPELLVPYGRSLWAFEGSSGTSAGINEQWSDEFELDHRTWSSASLADIDGDATMDLVLGSMVISMAMADVRPLTDGRGIEFNPSAPDPGEEVTITAYVENSGTAITDDIVDVALYADGEKIGGTGISSLDPVEPSGSGSFASFSVEWSGGLGDHLFELVLDPNQNLTQTRFDNDVQIRTLSIVPPYNATFEIPTDPIRVDPGSSSQSSFNVRSTGRLAGTWTLSIDDSNLPPGWSWEDVTPGGILSVDIAAGSTWSPELMITAPSDALGSDSGFLGLTLSHDDGEAEISANLPIEANRTRGLSIRGPDGTSHSTGYGLVSEEAMAWLLIENVGNAPEEQIAISWDGTEWGSDLRIFDSEGVEISALSLAAGELKEVTARLSVPAGVSLGDEVTTPLSMCVGVGEEQECSEVDLGFVASGAVVQPGHLRSVPSEGLVWEVIADLPDDSTSMNWSMSDAGMMIQGWSWESSGQLSLSGDEVSISGTQGSRVSGHLTLDLPDDAPPSFHIFHDPGGGGTESPLSLSIEVLQIHRAAMEVNSPTTQPFVVDVGESNLVVLRLENPGNGDDSYSLSYEVVMDENITSDPGLEVSFSSNPVQLGPGSLRTLPLSVSLPEDTPARVPVKLRFTMTSDGNTSVSDFRDVEFEVRQDHRWQIDASHLGSAINESVFLLEPGDSINMSINATNSGNLVDDLELIVDTEIIHEGADDSQGWIALGSSVEGVGVNESVFLNLSATASEDAWNGSKLRVSVTAMARNEAVMWFTFDIEVAHVSGWGVSSNMADLEIDPGGSQVDLEILQMGNSPSAPFVSVYVAGESGWEIQGFEGLQEVPPQGSVELSMNITPPDTATPGKSVELHVRVREGDSSGLVEVTLPLRVSVLHNFSIEGSGPWLISADGGHPQVKVWNTGNAPSTISLDVQGLPVGWVISGETEVVLAVGEHRGIPIELIPDPDWNGEQIQVVVLAGDSTGNEREMPLELQKSDYSWATSPYIFATLGDNALIGIHGADQGAILVDSVSNEELSWSSIWGGAWEIPAESTTDGEITVDGVAILTYVISVPEYHSRDAICSIGGDVGSLQASCSIGNGSSEFHYQALLISEGGEVLDYIIGTLGENESAPMVNLSGESWDPSPGIRTVSVRVLDGRGSLVDSSERTFEVRRTDWNVGIESVELVGEGEDQKVNVPTKRLNENLLENADCIITLSAGTHYSEHIVDMTQAFVPTPKFDRPDVEDGTELVVRIGCSFPWDEDSDLGDDEARLVLSGRSAIEDSFDELGTGALAAILVIGSYIGLALIVRNNRERERLMSITQEAIDKISAKNESENEKLSKTEHADDSDVGGPESNGGPEEEVEMVDEDLDGGDEFDERLRRLLGR
ncbi:MAG: hypothetical protein CMB67_05070 [Euryarchaeota archaeon]|nr:hypothetical protein [Euryarchaeota archaeon]